MTFNSYSSVHNVKQPSQTISLFKIFVATVVVSFFVMNQLNASDKEEFKIKRQEIYQFSKKPTISVEGDKHIISFTSKAFCDVTIVVENNQQKIIRNIVCGILGKNSPAPLKQNALSQSIVWDGKDDTGKYIDDKSNLSIRVSLGLKPKYEKSLYTSQYKRIGFNPPLMEAIKEGVLVFEGQGIDQLKLFDHEGNYKRTLYPFPAETVKNVNGLNYKTYPQDGQKLPYKHGYHRATMLTSSPIEEVDHTIQRRGGRGAAAMAVHGNNIALINHRLNRLTVDGSKGFPLTGPATGLDVENHKDKHIPPSSAVFSPDGKWLYTTGYIWKWSHLPNAGDCYHVVMKMEYAGDKKPVIFKGRIGRNLFGTDNKSFKLPTSVACDAKGRVYVSDFGNNRIQIFSSEAKYLKTIKAFRPMRITIDHKTQEMMVVSSQSLGVQGRIGIDLRQIKNNTITNLGTFEKPRKLKLEILPKGISATSSAEFWGQLYSICIDMYSKKQRVWMAGRMISPNSSIHIYEKIKNQWKTIKNFNDETKKTTLRTAPPPFSRIRLYWDNKTERLYLGEEFGFGKSFKDLIVIDPITGSEKLMKLPYDAKDIGFDNKGLIYLLSYDTVVRFDPKTWREVPWNYGMERHNIGSTVKPFHAISALIVPGAPDIMASMSVSPNGNVVVQSTGIVPKVSDGILEKNKNKNKPEGKKNTLELKIYQGRGGFATLNIWDKHGKVIHKDAIPGLPGVNGVHLDNDNNLFVKIHSTSSFNGKQYFDYMAESMMMFKPGKGHFISTGYSAILKLPKSSLPKRQPDLFSNDIGDTWAENVEWVYGCIGTGGQRCIPTDWESRATTDSLGRTFIPVPGRYCVSVVDKKGNLITRIGKYGNTDSYEKWNSASGDGVALINGCYLGTQSDKRLFIHDSGNTRIISVSLNYHVNERIQLKGIVAKKGK